ncbi:MAG TPA: membrane protein insertase YidC, partial [Chitinophagales bacterium]|nr:membrane protein insertase YidC [Chitinophagales bacterium]
RDSIEHVIRRDSVSRVAPVLQQSHDSTAAAAAPAAIDTVPEQTLVVENDVMAVTFTNKGAAVKSVLLKEHKTWDGHPLYLFNGTARQSGFTILTSTGEINTANLVFTSDATNTKISGDGKATVAFSAPLTDGRTVEQRFTFGGKSHEIAVNFRITGSPQGIQKIILYDRTTLNGVGQVRETEIANSGVYFKYANDDDVEDVGVGETAQENIPAPIDWVSFKQQYFNASIISKGLFESGTVRVDEARSAGALRRFETELVLAYDGAQPIDVNYALLFAPNNYQDLKRMDIGMQKIIPLGWGIFAWMSNPVNKWFIIPMFNFLNDFMKNYGLIILIMTVIIKILLFPLTYKSLVSAAKMRVLKPEIDELKEQYKDDQAKFGAEQMKLFQRAGVNPLGGCIPMLLQLPILVAMYSFFPVSIELRQESFLWAHDLSTFDNILPVFGMDRLPFTIPFFGDHVSLFTILMTITSIIMAVYNNQMTGATGQMKWMAYIFPIMLLGIFNNLSAALTYYYFLSNVISFAMQWGVQKFALDEAAIHRQIQENKKKTPKKSGFMQRLEDMQRQQRQAKQPSKPRRR